MKKVSPQKKQPRISVKSNLLANVDLNQIDFTKDVLEHLQDILEKIENTFTLTPRTPSTEIPNGSLSLNFLGAELVSASGKFAKWNDGGILKAEKEFKKYSLMVLLPISRRFQVFIHIKNTASPGFFFIEREENNKRTLIKLINFPGSQGALINFIAETTGKSDSQSFFISYREKNDPESKYTRWEMDRCIFTELT